MRNLFIIAILFSILFSCQRNHQENPVECIIPAVVPFQPYSYPVWHPNGNLLAFNYTPLANISANGCAPCIWYSHLGKADSVGFYIMNKDGTSFKRITNFNLLAPSWSPDGNWIAFSLGSQLYKMRFTGNGFDTSNMIQLTTVGGNFYPSWTANSDSIYYDSNAPIAGATGSYTIWKMANDGAGKERVVDATTLGDVRFPFVASNSKLYHTRYVSGQPEIFAMNKDGSTLQQLTFNGKNGNRNMPKFFQGNLFYNDNGTLQRINAIGTETAFTSPSVTFNISSSGEIIYSKMDYSITTYNKQIGTLWIINTDGSNNRQLTFNHL